MSSKNLIFNIDFGTSGRVSKDKRGELINKILAASDAELKVLPVMIQTEMLNIKTETLDLESKKKVLEERRKGVNLINYYYNKRIANRLLPLNNTALRDKDTEDKDIKSEISASKTIESTKQLPKSKKK